MSSQKLVIILENSPEWFTPPVFPERGTRVICKALRHRSDRAFSSFSCVQVRCLLPQAEPRIRKRDQGNEGGGPLFSFSGEVGSPCPAIPHYVVRKGKKNPTSNDKTFYLTITPSAPLSLARVFGPLGAVQPLGSGSWAWQVGFLPTFLSFLSHGSPWEEVTQEAKPAQGQSPPN